MSSLSTILILGNFWIHVCSSNHSNEAVYVEVSIDKPLGFAPTLDILYIEPYDSHIRFWRYFDDSWSQNNGDVVENVVFLDNCLNHIYC